MYICSAQPPFSRPPCLSRQHFPRPGQRESHSGFSPPGDHQEVDGIQRHGKLLPPFSAQGCTPDVPTLRCGGRVWPLQGSSDSSCGLDPNASQIVQRGESGPSPSYHAYPIVAGVPLALTTDASDFAVGAVLEQRVAGIWQSFGFFSSRLRPSQLELCHPLALADHLRSATDRELLAAYRAVRHFHHLLKGRKFTLFTDHKPLVGMMAKASDSWSAMQARHFTAISEYTTNIQHLDGKVNVVADALSWVEVDQICLGVDYNELAQAHRLDPETAAARTAVTNLHFRDVVLDGVTLLCDVSRCLVRKISVCCPLMKPKISLRFFEKSSQLFGSIVATMLSRPPSIDQEKFLGEP